MKYQSLLFQCISDLWTFIETPDSLAVTINSWERKTVEWQVWKTIVISNILDHKIQDL